MSALSSGKIDKYEHLTGEEILLFKDKNIKDKKYNPLSLHILLLLKHLINKQKQFMIKK